MATVTEAEPVAAGSATFRPFRVTIERYTRMVESGVLGPKDPVFLWKGRLVEKMPKGPAHSSVCSALSALLGRMLPDTWHVRVEQPIALSDDSMPEPDLTVVRGAPDRYWSHHPTPGDAGIAVEVADTSLKADSGEVLRSFARDGIPVYWIVNLRDRRLEIYTGPSGPMETPGYRSRQEFGIEDSAPVVIDGQEVGRVAIRGFLR